MEKNKRFIIQAIFGILILIVFLKLLIIFSSTKISECNEVENSFFSYGNLTRVEMFLPAVDANDNGVTTKLKVEKIIGTGRTLTEIDNLLFWTDTQHSIRIAKMIAGNITEKNLDDYDFIYTITANASLVGGPSAGAALTIATISALLEKSLKKNVMITGGINSDGSISPVDGIIEKAKAAKNAGADIFLVPALQSGEIIYEETESCETFGEAEVCTTETRPMKINITEEIGIRVYEVSTIREAINYFFD